MNKNLFTRQLGVIRDLMDPAPSMTTRLLLLTNLRHELRYKGGLRASRLKLSRRSSLH